MFSSCLVGYVFLVFEGSLFVCFGGFCFGSLGNVFNELIKASSAAERVMKVLDAVPEHDPEEGEPVTTLSGHIKLEDVQRLCSVKPVTIFAWFASHLF